MLTGKLSCTWAGPSMSLSSYPVCGHISSELSFTTTYSFVSEAYGFIHVLLITVLSVILVTILSEMV